MRVTPSMVAVNKSESGWLITVTSGDYQSKNTIFSVKRLIGRKFSDKEVQQDKAWLL